MPNLNFAELIKYLEPAGFIIPEKSIIWKQSWLSWISPGPEKYETTGLLTW